MRFILTTFCLLLLLAPVHAQERRRAFTAPAAASGGCDAINNANLKAYWRLEETGATFEDTKGANDLGEGGSVGSEAGIIGNAITFAGTEAAGIGDTADLSAGNTDFSVGGWIKLGSKASLQWIICKSDGLSAAGSEYALFYNNGSDRLVWRIYDATAFTDCPADVLGSPSTGVFYHCVGVHNAATDTLTFYVNGVAQTPVSHTTGSNDTGSAFELGTAEDGSARFTGSLDECFFYRGVLDATQIGTLYNSGTGCRPAGL